MNKFEIVKPQNQNRHDTKVSSDSITDLANFSLCQDLPGEYIDKVAELQTSCNPMIPKSAMFSEFDVRDHIKRCSECCWFIVHEPTGKLVAMQLGFITNFNLSCFNHSKKEFIGKTGTYAHNPNGRYYYSNGMFVDPDFKGLGFTKLMFQLIRNFVNRNELYGIIEGVQFSDYLAHSESESPNSYLSLVSSREIDDKVVTEYLNNGYRPLGLINDYHPNLNSLNYAVFMIWYGEIMSEKNWESFVH